MPATVADDADCFQGLLRPGEECRTPGDTGDVPTAPSAIDRFSAPTRAWFTGAFDRPTAAQEGAWTAISSGEHALVVAPTGSGKTLAAFLWSLDRLATTPLPEEEKARCRVLYVSPLKALAVDVERNLRAPLTGIGQAAARLGLPRPEISVGIRSGDTPADERRAFARRPTDILITTPGVAVPAAHQPGPRGAARGRDGDPRRGARGLRQQARRAPGGLAWTGWTPCWTSRRSGSGCRPRCGRSRRSPPSWPVVGRCRSSRRPRPSSGTCRSSCRSRT